MIFQSKSFKKMFRVEKLRRFFLPEVGFLGCMRRGSYSPKGRVSAF